MFIGFANFYCQFIYNFSKIAALFILILKTSGSKIPSALQILRIGVLPGKENNVESNRSGDNSNSVTIEKSDGAGDRNLVLKADFLTPIPKIAFAILKKAFTEALILHHCELD